MKSTIFLAAAFLLVAPTAFAAPKLLDCATSSEPDWCRQSQTQYREERSNAGGYTPMRNVAYCLWTGCDGAFAIDRKQSCALRRQIMQKHRKQVDGNDEIHFANCVSSGL